MIEQIQALLSSLPPEKVAKATRDLHFDWSDLSKLTSGQLAVLSKRLRKASFKTKADFDAIAEQSELVRSMRKSLANLREGIINGPGPEDSE